jgi:hypothetical protein
MKTSVRLVLPLLAVVSGFLFLSLVGCSSAPEAPPKQGMKDVMTVI